MTQPYPDRKSGLDSVGLDTLRPSEDTSAMLPELMPPPNFAPGMVYLVGAGPGDPGLMTLRGWAVLNAAEVVLHDRLGCEAILALLPKAIRRIDVGKLPGERMNTQEVINTLLIEEALAGRRVVRLKGGDPFVFGRGSEEILVLRAAGIQTGVVPGISSSLAAATSAGIPVTHRAVARSFCVSTGRSEEGTVPPIGAADTQVVLMAVGSLAEVAAQILAAGRDGGTPAALVQDATTHRQRVLRATLATIASRAAAVGITAPAVLIVGEVAALDLRWQPDATPHSDLKESAPNEQ